MDNLHQHSAQKQVHSSRGHSGQNINVANYSSYALEVHPVHIIVGEINNVLAAMRLNSRWSSRARILNSTVHEGPLLKGFRTLRNYLDHHPIYDISRVDGLIYLKPFLSVIRSEETSGPITGIALDSINKFLKSFLKLHTPNVAKAIESIAEAVIHCRFEATDPDSDEVVLIKILQVLLSCIHSSVGVLLRDDIILEMTQTCFRMSTQSRLSALLRKTAEQTLIDMILTTFQRRHDYDNYQNIMYHLQTQEEHHPLPDTPRTRHTNPQGVLFHSHERAPDQPVQDNNNYGHSHAQVTNVHNVSLQNIKPFSNSCIVKIFLFVCNLISGKVTPNTSIAQTTLNTVVHLGWDLPALLSDPNHEHYHHSQPESTFANKTSSQEGAEQPTQTTQEQPPPPPADNLTSSEQAEEDICLLGLTILNGILERSIQSLAKNKSILKIIQHILTKNLLKNINSDNLGIVSISLRVYFILFIHLKEHLKGPLELFINSLIKIIDLKIAYYEKQEVILESILEFCKDPYFVQDLFVNYDCDQHCSNLFESLSKFLYKNAFPVGGSIYSSHLVALDSLLAIVQNITNRVLVSHSSVDAENDEFETIAADNLRNMKKMKTTLFSGVELFNPDPEPGLKYLRESQILPTPPDSISVARFLRHTYGLNKTTLGEYIGKGKEFNISVLNSYVSQFNFSKDEKFIYSLRNFMESFRIPGEAPVIARILETFAQHYYDAVKEPFANVDAVYVLCYSVVLLNVDQHNPEVKNRMTEEQFIRNNRGINGGKDLPVEMLKEIYYNIKNSEMKILEEHLAAGGSVNDITDGMWRQLLTKPYAPFIAVKSHSYDKDVFQVLWGHLIAAISVVFDTANDDHILEKCMHGYNLCAQISAHYGTHEVTDSLITSLSKFSGLLGLPQNVNYAYNYGYTSTNPTVGALANFVHNKKAQSSTKFVFSTVLSYPNLLRESWKSVFGCILTLHKLKILQDFLDKFELQDEDSTNGNSADGPNQSNRSTVQASGMGFLSILSASGWFGGASYSAPESSASQDPSYGYESDLQAELQRRAQELIAQYNIPTIILGSKAIITDNESLLGLLRAVMLATMRTRTATATTTSTGTAASTTPAIPQVNHPFDEKAALFAVDVLFNLLFINIERFHEIWKPLAEHFGNLLEAATTSNDSPRGTATSMALVDRIVTGLFAFIMKLRSAPDPKLSEDEIFQCLHVLAKLGGPPRPSSPNTRETQPQPSALEFQAKKIINALIRLYDGSFIIRSNEVLKTLNYVLDVTCHVPSAELQALHFVKSLVLKSDSVDGVPHYTNLNTSNFNIWIESAALFMTPKNSSSICIQTMEILLNMFSVVPVLLHIPLNDTPSPHQEEVLVTQAWSVYWLPILQKFCGLCHDPRLDVRNAGMTFLQRALLSPQLSLLPPTGWLLCFQDVMFPLMENLLKGPAEVLPPPPSSRHKLDSAGLEETRLRAAALLSKIFLQYLPKLTTLPNFSQLWLDILRFMEMYMVADSELLAEAVRESLKNVLLVMSASGLFQTGFSSTLTSPSEDIWKLSSSDLLNVGREIVK